MNNLFSVFDPSTSFYFNFNWLSTTLVIFSIPSIFWVAKNQMTTIIKNLINTIAKELNLNFGLFPTPGHAHWGGALFMFILLNNFWGMIPYTFTSSSHLSFSLSLGLSFWLSYMVYSFSKDLTHSLAHFVPLGTPGPLLPFMVLIEITSSVIRPLTLSVRLAANMVAGHLLLTLISTPMASTTYLFSSMIFSGLFLLVILESAVAVIQAYVFSMLSALYLGEVNFDSLN